MDMPTQGRFTKEEFLRQRRLTDADMQEFDFLVMEFVEEQSEMILYWVSVALDGFVRMLPTSLVVNAVGRLHELAEKRDPDLALRMRNTLRAPLDDAEFTQGFTVPPSVLKLQNKILEAIL